jgi:ribosomal protein L37AE/L43A
MAPQADRATGRVSRLILLGALLLPAALIFMRWGWSLLDMRSFQPPAPIIGAYWVVQGLYMFVLIRALTGRGFTLRVLLAFIWPAFDVLAALAFAPIADVQTDGLPSVAVAGFVCWGVWFFRPIAGPAERRRRAFSRYALFHALRQDGYRRRVVVRFAYPILLIAAMPVVTALLVWLSVRQAPSPGGPGGSVPLGNLVPLTMVLVMMVVGMAFVASAAALRIVRESTTDGIDDRPCHHCGMDCREVHFDERGWGRCPECGSAVHRGQWIAPPCLSRDATSRRTSAPAFWLPMLGGLSLLPLALVILAGVAFDHPLGFIGVSVLFMMLPMSAWRPWAAMIAHAFDRQHIECRECGYDLRGTPTEQGIGTCPECGTAFAKLTPVPRFDGGIGQTTEGTEIAEED